MAQFKTRARALDLLGRQQIAGIPTAINELIKNAHDAYADMFDIDFFRNNRLLVLRDDGMGMTRDEFETRWLTLGTESKLENVKTAPPPIDKNKQARQIMGEKGIGRLAIAAIGNQVLIISKAKQREKKYKIVVSFINWDIFALPGINLEDVAIPVKEYSCIPNRTDVHDIITEVINSFDALYAHDLVNQVDYERIKKNILSFDINPSLLTLKMNKPSEFGDESGGTHFYISPVYDTLDSDIEGDKLSDEATKMEKMLMGFHNTMTPNHPQPAVDISFRDYRSNDGSFVSIIDKEHFFTPDEFEMADHHFLGKFDKYGQFNGQIKIYGERTYNHIVSWSGNQYRETDCGPFSINLAYLQGELKSSRVDLENYARIKAKGDKFGGLYIYRNNIRVLPYGDSDYDFLDIEKNRSKRASTYFFSYRRMFGAIEIADSSKSDLIEKAGREGFIENKAYRQLQSILKNFFIQLAADFFGESDKSPRSDFFNQKRDEYNAYHRALERRDKLAKNRKEKFVKDLDRFFANLSSHKFDDDVKSFLADFRNNLDTVLTIKDADVSCQQILDFESKIRQKIYDYKKSISVTSPKGFTISKDTRMDFESYLNEFKILDQTIFNDALARIDTYVSEYTQRLNLEISKRRRLENAVNIISSEAISQNKQKKTETTSIVSDVSNKIKDLTTELIVDLDYHIRSVKDQFKLLPTDNVDNFDLVQERQRMADEINKVSERNTEVMDRIIRQFESFYIEKNEDGQIVTNDQIADATSEELEELRDRLQTDIELSQLGLAVGILNHEFNSTVGAIRHSLKDLKAWSDIDTQLEGVYKNLKVNFEHLDGYLNLFTPLNRRLNRNKEDLPLIEIKTFLIDLFKQRLDRHNISFKHTNGFAAHKIYGFRSTFYPVFVNIVDNAIFWLKQSDIPNKVIRLHADDTGIYISNNGPEIKLQDRERIFELRFSRKPNGRGLGLSISKEVLNAENYDICLDAPKEEATVTFKIYKMQQEDAKYFFSTI